jgi:hypothetical protein
MVSSGQDGLAILAELYAARLRRRQRRFGPLGDLFPLMLGNRGLNAP